MIVDTDDKTHDLFGGNDAPAIARGSDPAQSKHAAATYDSSGKRRTDRQKVLVMCQVYPGHTVAEYSLKFKEHGMDWYKAANLPRRRLSELAAMGDVRAGRVRECGVTKSQAATYWPAD
jgi:hypothetical protein